MAPGVNNPTHTECGTIQNLLVSSKCWCPRGMRQDYCRIKNSKVI